ncbi:hypothetical protein ACR6HW_13425 [Fusibacter sp. JL298sf-3]
MRNKVYSNSSLKFVYNTLETMVNDSNRSCSERAEALGYLLEIDDFLMSYYNMLQKASQLLKHAVAYLYIGQIYALQYNKGMAFYYWSKANDWAVANNDFHFEADANFLKGRLLYELIWTHKSQTLLLNGKISVSK